MRDMRNGNWFWVHRCVIRCWTKKIGAKGVTLYALLADHDRSDEHRGLVFPSQATMAEIIGWDRSTVNKWIRVIEKAGLISKDKRGRYFIVYTLNKVRCPITPDGIHRNTDSPDVAGRHILHGDVVSEKPDVTAVTPDVAPYDTKEKKEREKLKEIYADKQKLLDKMSLSSGRYD